MQTHIEEVEVRYKVENNRIKSKLQNELDDVRARYESLKKAKNDFENHLKKLQGGIKDAQDRLSEEQAAHGATRDLLGASEKRFGKILFFKINEFIDKNFCFLN